MTNMTTEQVTTQENVPFDLIKIGTEYVFGSYTEYLGFTPTICNNGGCRVVVTRKGRSKVFCEDVNNGNWDADGFFEIGNAKRLYRQALELREIKVAPKSILTTQEITQLVNAL